MKRRRTIPPANARAAIAGEVALRDIYSRQPAPESTPCSRCGGEAAGLGHTGGLCLKCRFTDRETAPDRPEPF